MLDRVEDLCKTLRKSWHFRNLRILERAQMNIHLRLPTASDNLEMLHKSGMRLSRVSLSRNLFSTSACLRQQPHQTPTYQSPSPTPEPDNPHRAFYKSFGRPIAKVFLMSLATYQVLRYAWLRLEATEEKENKQAEVEGLEKELKDAVAQKTPKT